MAEVLVPGSLEIDGSKTQRRRNKDISYDEMLLRLNGRIVFGYDDLRKLADGLRVTSLVVGATIGTFDLLHTGHCRYLMAAKAHCDVLFVAADSDDVVKSYKKNPNLPVVPQDERLEMLLHTGYADYVSLITDVDEEGNWQYGFLDAVRPDIFVTSIGSYPETQLADIMKRCREVVELPRQAPTSSSEKVRQMMVVSTKSAAEQLRALAERLDRGEV